MILCAFYLKVGKVTHEWTLSETFSDYTHHHNLFNSCNLAKPLLALFIRVGNEPILKYLWIASLKQEKMSLSFPMKERKKNHQFFPTLSTGVRTFDGIWRRSHRWSIISHIQSYIRSTTTYSTEGTTYFVRINSATYLLRTPVSLDRYFPAAAWCCFIQTEMP